MRQEASVDIIYFAPVSIALCTLVCAMPADIAANFTANVPPKPQQVSHSFISVISSPFTRFGQYINTITAIKAITGSPFVVKCYNCNGFESMLTDKKTEKPADMYLAGDSIKAKEVAKVLVRELGFDNCFDYGGDNCVEELDNLSLQWLTTSVDPQQQYVFANMKRK